MSSSHLKRILTPQPVPSLVSDLLPVTFSRHVQDSFLPFLHFQPIQHTSGEETAQTSLNLL